MSTANDTARHIANYHRRMEVSRAEDKIEHRDGAKRILAEKGIRTEVNDAGRIIAASLPSKSNPNEAPYALERSMKGAWMHTDSRCPAWVKGVPCWHVRILTELCEEIDQ